MIGERGRTSFAYISHYKALRETWLKVDSAIFSDFQMKFACLDQFEDSDFKKLVGVKDLLGLKSLRTVHLTGKECKAAESDEEQQQWKRNVAALESFLNRKLKVMRDAEKAKAEKDDEYEPTDNIDDETISRGIKRSADDELDGRPSKISTAERSKQASSETQVSDAEELKVLKTQAYSIGTQLASLHDQFAALHDRIKVVEERMSG